MKHDFTVLVTLHQRSDIALNFNLLIDSIYSNTLKPKNVLILVDGPIELSFKKNIENKKKNRKFDTFFNPTNIGLANILNLGLAKINTTWVIRVDGDDICLSNRFKKIMDNVDPNLSIIGSYISEIDENKKSRIKSVPLSHKSIIKYIKFRNPFNHCAVAYQRDHVIKIGGYPNIYLQEDYGLWVKMIANGFKGINLPEVLVNASFNSQSYKRRTGAEYLKSDFKLSMLKYDLGVINLIEFLIVILVRISFILMPNFLKKNLYALIRIF